MQTALEFSNTVLALQNLLWSFYFAHPWLLYMVQYVCHYVVSGTIDLDIGPDLQWKLALSEMTQAGLGCGLWFLVEHTLTEYEFILSYMSFWQCFMHITL